MNEQGSLLQVTTSYMKMISSYVMQDDQLFPMLTVFETFMFAAEVRLPPSISNGEKKKRVIELLTQLGLTVCIPLLKVLVPPHLHLSFRFGKTFIFRRVQCILTLEMKVKEESRGEKNEGCLLG